MRLPAYSLLTLALLSTACGGSQTATSPSTTSTPSNATERFDAILEPGASAFYAFSVGTNGGVVTINFASLSPLNRPGLLPMTMEIGYGVPAGEGCDLRKTVQTTPGLTSQLTDTLTTGTYCANIADVGKDADGAGELHDPDHAPMRAIDADCPRVSRRDERGVREQHVHRDVALDDDCRA